MDPNKYKTALCKNYMEGFCSRASGCSFAHGEEELRERPTFPTVPKPKGMGKGPRSFASATGQPGQPPGLPTVASLSAMAGMSTAATSEPPVIQPGATWAGPPNMPPTLESPPGGERMLKTQLCKYFMGVTGCARGDLCWFAHGEDELRPPPEPEPGKGKGKGRKNTESWGPMAPVAGTGKGKGGYGAYPGMKGSGVTPASPYASYGQAGKGGKPGLAKGGKPGVVPSARHAQLVQQLKIAGKHSVDLRNAWFAQVGQGSKDPSKHPEAVLEAFLQHWPKEVAIAEAEMGGGPELVAPNGNAPVAGHPTLNSCLESMSATHPSLTPAVIVCMGEPKDAEGTLISLQVPPHIAAGVAAHWDELMTLASTPS